MSYTFTKELLVDIFASTEDTFNNIKNALKTNKMEFYLYIPRDEKPKTLVLKGIYGGFDENNMIEAINELQLLDLKII